MKIVATNRRARHDYFIEETVEAGLSLTGTEVKSLRAGRASLVDSFGRIANGEVFLMNMNIPPYEHGNIQNHEPTRTRKLLLKKSEIRKLIGKVQERGYTLIPLKVYFKHGFAKTEMALAKGKRQYDKRRTLAEKDAQREVERAFKERQKTKKVRT